MRTSTAPREEGSVTSLVEPPRAPDLTPQRERLLELDADVLPRLRAPALVQDRAQDAVDAEPGGCSEAGVGVVHFPFGPRGPARASRSLDELVSPHENRLWDRQAEGLGGLQIDDDFVTPRLVDRQV